MEKFTEYVLQFANLNKQQIDLIVSKRPHSSTLENYHDRQPFRFSNNGYFPIITFRCSIPQLANWLIIVCKFNP